MMNEMMRNEALNETEATTKAKPIFFAFKWTEFELLISLDTLLLWSLHFTQEYKIT